MDCAPQEVIERLNSLGEEGGKIQIFEMGASEQKPEIHANFRIISTANPSKEGANEISKAFYNRCIRINIPNIDDPEDLSQILEQRISLKNVIENDKQIMGDLIDCYIKSKQIKVPLNKFPSGYKITMKNLLSFGEIFASTFDLKLSFELAFSSFLSENKELTQALFTKNLQFLEKPLSRLPNNLKELNLAFENLKSKIHQN